MRGLLKNGLCSFWRKTYKKIYNLLIRTPSVLLGIAIIPPFDAQWNSSQYGVQHTRVLGAVEDDVGRRR